jgi:F-type H+-transporting ATPase subunit b
MKQKSLRWIAAIAVAAALLAPAAALAASEGHGLPWTDFVKRCINFGILAVAVVLILRKPLGKALGERSENIKNELAELEAKKAEAEKAYKEMERRLADAQSEREQILADFRAQGEREYEKIVDNAKSLAERIKSQAQFTIEQETSQAKAELRREVAELSAQVAEDLLKQNIKPEDQARLVSDYLAKVQEAQ